MINEPDYLDPAYWESQGITTIEVNLNDDDSIEAGMKEIAEQIKEAVEELTQGKKTDF